MILRAEGLTFRYPGGTDALSGCDFHVASGRVSCLLGPNAAGKTTLMNLLARRARVQGGRIEVDGAPGAFAVLRIGWAPSTPLLYDDVRLDVFVETAFGPALGLPRAVSAERGRALAGELRMDDHYRRKPRTYSGGTRMKAAVLLAFLERPDLVVLDEPFAGLDVETVDRLAAVIRRAVRDEGAAVVISDHQLGILDELADDVTFIAGGRTLASGTAAELTAAHGTLRRAYRAVVPGAGDGGTAGVGRPTAAGPVR